MGGLKTYLATFFTNWFVLGVFCLGIALSFYGGRAIYQFYYGNYSVPVVASVIDTRTIETTRNGTPKYSYQIHYGYQYEGKNYDSHRYAHSYSTPSDVLEFGPGDTLTAYVNPEDPGDAVIVNEFSKMNVAACVLGVTLIFWSFIVHAKMD